MDTVTTGVETKSAENLRPGWMMIASLIGALSAVYLVSQFLRNSTGVIAPDLERELSLTSESLSLLSGVFFVSFTLAQIPLGVLIDRYGPKAAMLGSLALAAVGCVVFSLAQGTAGLVAGRILMGLGCSSFFMGPLTIYARWFAPKRFSSLTGMQLGIGSMGTLFATAPMAYAADAFGWRTTFLGVGVLALSFGFLLMAFVRDDPPGAPVRQTKPVTLGSVVAGIMSVWKVPGVFRLFAMHLGAYSAFATMIGLWGGPYLSDIYGYGLAERGNILFLMALGQIIGVFVWGPSDRLFKSRRIPVITGALATIATLLVFAWYGRLPETWLGPAFFWFGFICAYTPVVTAHGRLLFPAELVGRGITFLNMGTMGGVFVQQGLTGLLVGFLVTGGGERPIEAYSAVFAFVAGFMALMLLFYWRAPDPDIENTP